MKDFTKGEPTGWCCGDTKAMLLQVIKELEPKNIAEIGSFKGMSAYFMCKNSDAHIYCIDHWKGSKEHEKLHNIEFLYDTFIDNMGEYIDRITPIRASSEVGLNTLKEVCPEVDMIFIDGDHSYTGATHDISKCINLFPNATLCGDDYSWLSVQEAVNNMARHYNKQVVTIKERAWKLV